MLTIYSHDVFAFVGHLSTLCVLFYYVITWSLKQHCEGIYLILLGLAECVTVKKFSYAFPTFHITLKSFYLSFTVKMA